MDLSVKVLAGKLRSRFAAMKKPNDYAAIILKMLSLGAVDRHTPRKSAEFGPVKWHAFSQCYGQYGLIEQIPRSGTRPVVYSEPNTVYYNSHDAWAEFGRSKLALVLHAQKDKAVRAACARALGLGASATPQQIEAAMGGGHIFAQVGLYGKAYDAVMQLEIPAEGYVRFGIRMQPVSTYYLTPLSRQIIEECKSQKTLD